MSIDYTTLLVLPLGLLLPLATVVFFVMSRKKVKVSYDTIFYGIGSFIGAFGVAFLAFFILQGLFFTGFSADNYFDGYVLVSSIFSVLIAIIFIVCESLKMVTFKKCLKSDDHSYFPSLGFSAGVVLTQCAAFFVALNAFDSVTPLWAVFSGAFVLLSGVMYYVLSYASEVAFSLGSKGAAYVISSIYYLMWICMMLFIKSSVLVVTVASLFFVLSLVFGFVFIARNKKTDKGR